jgi:hypothetical protein
MLRFTIYILPFTVGHSAIYRWAFLFIDMEGLKSFQRWVAGHYWFRIWNAWAF